MNKELEAFYKIKNKLIKVEGNTTYGSIIDLTNLNIIEEVVKAFEIIKAKDVDVGWLKRARDLYEYNSGVGINSYSALTPEEYELLKEVLL